jgi:hypothetical protein
MTHSLPFGVANLTPIGRIRTYDPAAAGLCAGPLKSCGRIKATASALALELILKFAGVGEGKKVTPRKSSPRPLSSCPAREAIVVFVESAREVVGESDVVFVSAVL